MENQEKVILCLTVDWEGEHVRNIHDLNQLLVKFAPDIPVTHFICPAYFSNGVARVARRISTVVKEQDEVALHVHCYRSLIEYCGVKFRIDPNYYKKHLTSLISGLPKNLKHYIGTKIVSGRGVPLGVYNDGEINRIIEGSLYLLEKNLKISKISGFRAGGWLLRDEVFQVLLKNQLSYDSSAVPPEILSNGHSKNEDGTYLDDYGHNSGYFSSLVLKLWGGNLTTERFLHNEGICKATNNKPINRSTQPFRVQQITEMPNNGGLSDFASAQKTLIPLFHQLLEMSEKEQKLVFLNFGCHQEGHIAHKMALFEFLNYLHPFQGHIKFMTVKDALKLV